ncbi:30S ribosome-binding factor RbfA [Vineibacter terrae]|uniref:30S ribosome-binding factor RbfA n=1 Tax=Vineibacter terrae TaxID=2586908 RepID=UPI002E3060A9|nr:30S ribosome-binding factor RbfA [Vineibacter terrae]HEX2886090.1 30S ribosome-binding factor RbfA [Vineibacter terrae]
MSRHRRTDRARGAGPAGRTKSPRQLRVGEELRHVLAAVLERGEMRDPDLRGVSVTVTEVDVSPDLRSATAFVMPLAGADRERVMAALRRAAPWFRAQVAQRVELRHAPDFRFELDHSFDHAHRIGELLNSPSVARDLDAADEAEPKE